MPSSPERVTLLVIGAQTYLGSEVARFGRALGHRIIATAESIPALSHPWMHGVHWQQTKHTRVRDHFDGSSLRLIYCDTTLADTADRPFQTIHVRRPQHFLHELQALPTDAAAKFVLRSSIPHRLLPSDFHLTLTAMENTLALSNLPHAIARQPLLYGVDRPDSVFAMVAYRLLQRPTLPVETAALALLRLALEDDLTGIFGPAKIATLGDVMIAQ